jgi:alginate O-acetyltransferase complex protein AlgI
VLFNSQVFLFVFLPPMLAGWWFLRGDRWRLLFLTLMSYAFYGWWDWRFIPLMIASTTVDYVAGSRIDASADPATRKRWLVSSLTFNLAILGVFKYYGFFVSSVNAVAVAMGVPALFPVLRIVLPIGISFYTFNSMSYTIDIYRRRVKPAQGLLHFSAFVAMFPHLIAGPIVRYSDIEHQFAKLQRTLTASEASVGVFFFVSGLAKKLFLADRLAPLVDQYFASPGGPMGTAWLMTLGYTFQLYFDFSAYSDMAVGLAHLLGLQFPQNFNSPYKAVDMQDFWRRWHMSLSTWLRDYLFISLGGSRGGPFKTLRNLMITMFLGGLWHGAQWTFVVWGIYHGVLLVVNYGLQRASWVPSRRWLARSATFIAVVFGWVLFRSVSLPGALHVWSAMVGAGGFAAGALPPVSYLAVLTLSAVIAFAAPNTWEIKFQPRPLTAYALAVAFAVAVLCLENPSPFLYFQF